MFRKQVCFKTTSIIKTSRTLATESKHKIKIPPPPSNKYSNLLRNFFISGGCVFIGWLFMQYREELANRANTVHKENKDGSAELSK